MSWRDAPLYVDAHDLARWLVAHTAAWDARDPLAARVDGLALELLEAVAQALSFPDGRADTLADADRCVASLRVLLRLARDLDRSTPAQLRHASERLRVIGRQLGGWRKRVTGPQPPTPALGQAPRRPATTGA